MTNQEIIFFNPSVRKMRTNKTENLKFSDDFVDFIIKELILINENKEQIIPEGSNCCNEIIKNDIRINKNKSVVNKYISKGEKND